MGTEHPETIHRFFAAMQTGATAEEAMMSLFDENAIYIEPFSGSVRKHSGKAAIRKVLAESWKSPLPDMRIEVEHVEAKDTQLLASWTCHSPALPGGQGHGENAFTLK